MPHLAQITRETRLITKLGGITLVIVLLLFFSFKGYGLIQSVFFPKPPAPPEEGFGKLSQIEFPESSEAVPINYTINTIDGSLPAFSDRINVYTLEVPAPNLVALPNAKNAVAGVGFTGPESKVSDTVYQWFNNETASSIKYDILTKNFKLDTDINSKISSQNSTIQDSEKVSGSVFDFINLLGENTIDIDSKKSQVVYLKQNGVNFIETDKPFEAQLARVNLYQNDLVDPSNTNAVYPIQYPYSDRTILSFMVVPGREKPLVVSGEFINKIVNENSHSTYPIKTAQQAFDELSNGQGFVVSNPGSDESIDITDVTLGYYIGPDIGTDSLGQTQKHVQPIFIFKGSNGFKAYVPALSPASISN